MCPLILNLFGLSPTTSADRPPTFFSSTPCTYAKTEIDPPSTSYSGSTSVRQEYGRIRDNDHPPGILAERALSDRRSLLRFLLSIQRRRSYLPGAPLTQTRWPSGGFLDSFRTLRPVHPARCLLLASEAPLGLPRQVLDPRRSRLIFPALTCIVTPAKF